MISKIEKWHGKRYYSVDAYLKNIYGKKMYRLALSTGFSCPNRDGTKGSRGCIFCSEGGSGDFAQDPALSVTDQINNARRLVADKISTDSYIAYFQSFTSTYGPVDTLSRMLWEAVDHPQIFIIDIATRPDCLNKDILELLEKVNRIKPVWVELGLQTIHDHTADLIRRAFPLSDYDRAVISLKKRGINVITHLILGLPGESRGDILDSIRYISSAGTDGVKLSMLHILKGTDLGSLYEKDPFKVFTLEEYTRLIADCLMHLPPDIVVHRITGDGPKKLLIAPEWSKNKKMVLNTIANYMKTNNCLQGSLYTGE